MGQGEAYIYPWIKKNLTIHTFLVDPSIGPAADVSDPKILKNFEGKQKMDQSTPLMVPLYLIALLLPHNFSIIPFYI